MVIKFGFVAILALLVFTGAATAQVCSRAPDERTTPPPKPTDLTVADPKDRDFEIYDNSYALLIGQQNYLHRSHLDNVPSEIEALKSVLESQSFSVSVYKDLDSAQLPEAIECFIKSIAADDQARVVIYVGGHGDTRTVGTRKIGYLLPVDVPASTDDPDFVKKALPTSQFVEWSKWLEVKHSMFLLDICFGGAIFESKGDPTHPLRPSNYIFSDVLQSKTREFVAAGSEDQTVPAHSTFLQLIVDALLGQRDEADQNKDGYITGEELISYLKNTVPNYVDNQTPVSGKISDPNLDKGDIVFKLPEKTSSGPTTVSAGPDDIAGPTVTPIFRSGGAGSGKQIAQLYQIEKLLSTKSGVCAEDCVNNDQYSISIKTPENLPTTAIFDQPELTCVGCSTNFSIVDEPTLSQDKKTASVIFKSDEVSAVWRLRATIVVPSGENGTTGDKVLLVDAKDNKVTSVDANNLSVLRSSAPIEPGKVDKMHSIVLALQSNDTPTRRNARVDLAKLIEDDDGSLVSQLIRDVATGTYRYQLGIAEALSQTKDGWKTTESASKDILVAAKTRIKDPTLSKTIDAALANARSSVFYEVGADGWLTKANQLRPVSIKTAPLPKYEDIRGDQILKADSAVYLRAGPGVQFGVFGVLKGDACVRVVGKTEASQKPGQGWLDVVKSDCKG
ncbi:hypothetical protein GFPCMMHI_01106 [Ensifer adhaerens]|nr:hypothetical protein [Ensifer adhaerens]